MKASRALPDLSSVSRRPVVTPPERRALGALRPCSADFHDPRMNPQPGSGLNTMGHPKTGPSSRGLEELLHHSDGPSLPWLTSHEPADKYLGCVWLDGIHACRLRCVQHDTHWWRIVWISSPEVLFQVLGLSRV